MGRPWVDHPSWELVGDASLVTGRDVAHLLLEAEAGELTETRNAQLATFTLSLVVLDAIERLGIAPTGCAGHSLGEYSALVAAGTLSLEDALRLVRERGRLMRDSGEERPGGMAAVIGLNSECLAEVCRQASRAGVVAVANNNTPTQTVISGDLAGLARAIELAKQAGAERAARLAISIASHSPLMERASQRFSEFLAGFNLADPQVPVIGNLAGQLLQTADDVRRELAHHLVRPVDWTRSVLNMLGQGPVTFIELGPGRVLSGLIRRIHPAADVHAACDLGLEA
jgi:[acyl-carrier-protein] S-malonyltransferase